MLATTTERPVIVTAAPLTEAEQDALVGALAASEKVARVRANTTSAGTVRGFSMGGNVD
jgi:hypothetical protein